MEFQVELKQVRHIVRDVKSENFRDACKIAERDHTGYEAEFVSKLVEGEPDEMKEVVARCEACSGPVFNDDKHLYFGEDGVCFCDKCGDAFCKDVE